MLILEETRKEEKKALKEFAKRIASGMLYQCFNDATTNWITEQKKKKKSSASWNITAHLTQMYLRSKDLTL